MRRCLALLVCAPLLFVPMPGAGASTLDCRAPQREMLVVDFLFGRNVGHKQVVSERAWRKFLAREITPRFPDGLTVIDANGQWRDEKHGVMVRERAKHVMIVMPDGEAERARIGEIVAAYKRRFRQQSVPVVTRPACVSF
jgi:hypothetical protein